MRIANWARRATLAGFALSALCLFTGCPGEQVVTVVMRPDAGAASTPTAEETEGSTAAAGFGNLIGTVIFEGPPRNLPPLVAKDDPKVKPEDRAVCAAEPIPDESLLVNPDNKGLANVIVFLEKRPANIKPELAKPPSDPILFDQKGCRFLPHIVLLQAGQPLLVVSGDPIPHNTHTDPKRNTGFNQVIKPEDRKGTPIEYKKPEAGPIEVRCDYHPWMKAYHFPLDHPYVALTDKDGKFRIEGLPAGTHAFNVWHERGPGSGRLLERKLQIKIEPDKDTTKDLSYASAKFASVPGSLPRAVAYERLLQGGPIELTQTEEQR